MSLLAADINDAGITLLSDADILYREPGIALLEENGLTTGNAALAKVRIMPRRIHDHYWSNLVTESLPDHRFQHLSAADLVSRQMEQIWQKSSTQDDQLVIAVPAYMNNENLGLFLGICSELDIPVVAMVDAAVASTRRQYVNASPVHVDVSLHSAILSRVAQSGQVQIDKSAVVEESGLIALYEAWIHTISDAFVQQSRFDPLHTAATEQMLLNKIPTWLTVASGGGTVSFELEHNGVTYCAELEALALIAEVAPVYQRIVSQLRALYRADETPAIQLTDRAASMPGLAEMLKARVGGEVFVLEAAATSRGLLSRCRDIQRGDGRVSLIRQLPWDQSPVEIAVSRSVTKSGRPSHVLFDNRAFAISDQALNVGSQVAAGERWIELQQTMPGVSRKHCTLRMENGQCVVHDHSRFGTFLNGHRLDGSAVLQIGDLVRVGTPGQELRLIALENEHGA